MSSTCKYKKLMTTYVINTQIWGLGDLIWELGDLSSAHRYEDWVTYQHIDIRTRWLVINTQIWGLGYLSSTQMWGLGDLSSTHRYEVWVTCHQHKNNEKRGAYDLSSTYFFYLTILHPFCAVKCHKGFAR